MNLDFRLLPIVRQKSSGDIYYFFAEADAYLTGDKEVIILNPNGFKKAYTIPKKAFLEGFEVVGPPGLNTDILM